MLCTHLLLTRRFTSLPNGNGGYQPYDGSVVNCYSLPGGAYPSCAPPCNARCKAMGGLGCKTDAENLFHLQKAGAEA